MTAVTRSAPELWAGAECTVNRVGDRYGDQLARSGHADRLDDLDRLAALGVTAIRQPVLWERVAPNGVAHADWDWVDRRLDRLRALGVRPIVTLLHHGSGPRDTSLLDPSLPERLAELAHAVATRHPWILDWTPVNEPLTTARFSALYGLWYPHARDDATFARAFVNQIHAVRAAMRAVRAVNPAARLVQTEDLGRTHAVPSLAYQAALENDRRWLTFDVLTGALRPASPAWRLLRGWGIPERELAGFVDDPCPPDVVGLNHYLTSERFLDRRLSRYPAHTHGGNGTHRYADVEAVRVLAAGPAGPAVLLREAAERYGLPIAVTECHLGCTREQQMRWLAHVWSAATTLRSRGVDVRAVTAWSAFGAFDWANLLTRDDGLYEPGAFDVRAPAPRPTGLARMMRDLATHGAHDHPALDGDGWWQTPQRLLYPPAGPIDRRASVESPRIGEVGSLGTQGAGPARRVLLVTGADGALGRALVRACEERGLAFRALARRALDAASDDAVAEALGGLRPWAVVHAGGWGRVDRAERARDACWRENVCVPVALARACEARRMPLVAFSSHLVFDGLGDRPYVEGDATAPLGVYGASKAAAEHGVLAAHPSALVVRTGACFGARDGRDFLTTALAALAAGRGVTALADVVVSPTYVPALADAVLDLLIDGEHGVWHLANEGALSWLDVVRRGADAAGIDASRLQPGTLESVGLSAPRPRYSALVSERGRLLDTAENAICRYVAVQRRLAGAAAWRAHAPHPDTPARVRRRPQSV